MSVCVAYIAPNVMWERSSDLVLMCVHPLPIGENVHSHHYEQTPETDGLESWSSESQNRALHVDLHLRLPRAHAGSSLPLEIRELHTDLHQYDHLLSTPPSVHFKKLNLSTVMARIESEVCELRTWHLSNLLNDLRFSWQSVSGDVVSLWSTYNSITGTYNISRALIIQTEDGLVNVTAQLHNDDASTAPTSLNITTVEGYVCPSHPEARSNI